MLNELLETMEDDFTFAMESGTNVGYRRDKGSNTFTAEMYGDDGATLKTFTITVKENN